MKGYYLIGNPDVPEEKKTELAEKIHTTDFLRLDP